MAVRKATREEIAKMFDGFLGEIKNCQENHELEQIGGCVYCKTCNKRLYQGTIPKK